MHVEAIYVICCAPINETFTTSSLRGDYSSARPSESLEKNVGTHTLGFFGIEQNSSDHQYRYDHASRIAYSLMVVA